MTNATNIAMPRILRIAAVMQATGLSRSTLYRMQDAGTFPQSRSIAGVRAVGWSSAEIDAWIASNLR